MLVTQKLSIGNRAVSQLSRSRPVARRVYAMAAPTTIFVKAKVGEPTKLGDCPFCHRVLLTYEAKKLPYKVELLNLDDKPKWLLDLNGGKVPVIQEPGQPYMPDSDVITVHVEKAHPEPSMASSVPPEIGAKLMPSFRPLLLGPEAEHAEKTAQLLAELKAMDDYLQAHGPLFGGSKLNATDASIAPKLYHCLVALKHFKGWELPAEFGAVKRYMETLHALPEWKAVDYGKEAIIAGWKRHMSMGH